MMAAFQRGILILINSGKWYGRGPRGRFISPIWLTLTDLHLGRRYR